MRLLGLALLPCHRGEATELFNVDRCARMLGAFESNLLSVEVECPAIEQLRQVPLSRQTKSETQSKLHSTTIIKSGLDSPTKARSTPTDVGKDANVDNVADNGRIDGNGFTVVKDETAISHRALLYPHELLARASEAVSNAASCATAAGDTTPINKQTNMMRGGRTNRRKPDDNVVGGIATPMLSSSWPCSEGVGL